MINFLSKVFLISTFFIGLGAIAEKTKEALFSNENFASSNNQTECERIPNVKNGNAQSKIKVVRFESNSQLHRDQVQIKMILPDFKELSNESEFFEKPIAKKKIVIFRQGESIE